MRLKYKNYLLLLIVFFIQGCNSFNLSLDKTLLATTTHELEKKYKINHAELVVQYDLANNTGNTKCLYAKNLAVIINNPNQNKIFLQKFHNRKPQEFNQAAGTKIVMIKDLLSRLQIKYKFLSSAEARYFAKSYNITAQKNNISELLKIDKIISSIPLMAPEYEAKVTSHYGARKSPHKKKRKKNCFHSGIDLQAKKSSPVYAAASGIVTKVARVRDYGNFIEIKHFRKITTKYAHLKEIHIKEGCRVTRGQLIGIQGRSGNATGEHLHFEILLDNKAINPFDFISHCYKC
ncbi:MULTISPECIES: M23 family metallopeptidase [unclassified Rickettsia]|uniref:M23 family metallopeptidase n=1 Tax=unclassified Rickettsia TaxID=114295 RepID=UPI00209DF501|nr:M23 family metallopeptidase [Rickettsia endosymbiont of Ceutorhynchus assimilis]